MTIDPDMLFKLLIGGAVPALIGLIWRFEKRLTRLEVLQEANTSKLEGALQDILKALMKNH